MPPIPRGGVVAVTGATGYIGSHVVLQLLNSGYRVRACVRDVGSDKAAFLREMPQLTTGRLTVHAADINQPGVFGPIFQGCHGVVHAADQLMSVGGEEKGHTREAHPKAATRAIDGIICAIRGSGTVVRLVFTSSIAAVLHESDLTQLIKRPVIHDGRYPGEQFTSEQYKADIVNNGYAIAKLQVEAAVTAAAAPSTGLWDALIANPGDNFGPLLAAHQLQGGGGGFARSVARLLQGKRVAMLSMYHPMFTVDVRDTAAGHVALLESAEAKNGDRHLLISCDKVTMEELCQVMGRVFGEGTPLAPTTEVFDNEPAEVRSKMAWYRKLWAGLQLRNDGARRLGLSFRPFADTVRDTCESLISVCGVLPRMKPSL